MHTNLSRRDPLGSSGRISGRTNRECAHHPCPSVFIRGSKSTRPPVARRVQPRMNSNAHESQPTEPSRFVRPHQRTHEPRARAPHPCASVSIRGSKSPGPPVARRFQPRMNSNAHESQPTGPSRFVRPHQRTHEPRVRETHPRHPRHPRFQTFVPFVVHPPSTRAARCSRTSASKRAYPYLATTASRSASGL